MCDRASVVLPVRCSSAFHIPSCFTHIHVTTSIVRTTRVTATAVSLFMVPSCGILCHTTCGQLTISLATFRNRLKTFLFDTAFAALANLGYISDIIIIIIIITAVQARSHDFTLVGTEIARVHFFLKKLTTFLVVAFKT